MPRPRRATKPRTAKVPNLNQEVVNALGAMTGTEAPKGENLLGNADMKRGVRWNASSREGD